MSDFDTTKMTADDIRQRLVELGYSEEEAASIKGKSDLATELYKASATTDPDIDIDFGDEDSTGDFVEVEDEIAITEDEQIDVAITDPGWTDYVLSQMDDIEKQDGHPTVDGLRRMTEHLLGDITGVDTHVLQVPTPENNQRATVQVKVRIHGHDGVERYADGAADCYSGNTEEVYRNHPVAVAETRAEGRALKRLLKLRKVVSAEEISSVIDENLTTGNAGKITEFQIRAAETMCSTRLDADLKKIVNKTFPSVNNIDELTHSQGLELIKVLSSYQSTGLPEDCQGFNSNWRNE